MLAGLGFGKIFVVTSGGDELNPLDGEMTLRAENLAYLENTGRFELRSESEVNLVNATFAGIE